MEIKFSHITQSGEESIPVDCDKLCTCIYVTNKKTIQSDI